VEDFDIDLERGVAYLQLTRSHAANSLTPEFWRNLGPAIEALDRAGETRALVISGVGKHFCAGMDLQVFASGDVFATDSAKQREAFLHVVRDLQNTLAVLERARFPVIAAIQGACVGGGLELAAVCDLRVASADAFFRIEEINIGMMADLGALQRLPRLLPTSVVKAMAFMGDTLTAQQALTFGFVNHVEEAPDAALAHAKAMADRIASKAPLAIAGSKAALRYARDHSVDEGLEWAAMMQGLIWHPAEIDAAIQSKRAGAEASFSGLAPIRRLGS
jgi:enoyl-CoA hydratase